MEKSAHHVSAATLVSFYFMMVLLALAALGPASWELIVGRGTLADAAASALGVAPATGMFGMAGLMPTPEFPRCCAIPPG
jgi:hypothetical protein